MSFSQNIKDEILSDLSNKDFRSEAEAFGEYLTVSLKKSDIDKEYASFFDISFLSENDIKSILKGAYLSSGCIVDPIYDYHFEIILKNKACADYLTNLLEFLEFTPKYIKRKSKNSYSYVVYLKDSEQISDFLCIIGASTSLLKFEQVRVEKNVKNNINRNINCETANIAKTVKTSLIQINAINKLKQSGRFDILDDKLKYVANLRLINKNSSLDELSKLTNSNNRLTKSGIKHRLDKLIDLANNIDKKEGIK